jgi:diguanylate cyclase (GGDEF)-like protein/PAS domain S-box-containing protein
MRYLLKINILLAFGYFLGGYFGTLLSIPPSHASPIWPAAGIAFAGMVTYGYKVIPGLLVGSFCTQIFSFMDETNPDSLWLSLFIGGIASVASTLQAGLGAWLTRRYVGPDNPLTDDRSILRFILLGGPVSCTVSASLGAATLFLQNIIRLENLPLSWLTWWIGDTIGVVIFAPLLLSFIGVLRNRKNMRLNWVAFPLALLSLLVIVILHFGKYEEQKRISSLFDEHCSLLHNALQNELNRYLEINQNIKAFFDSSSHVTPEEFRNFTQPFLRDHADIQALEWIPRIPADQRSAYEKQLGKAFHIQPAEDKQIIVPAPLREEYFPIIYAEPLLGNGEALGLDISSKPNSYAAIQKSVDTAKTTLSRVIRLVQDPSPQPSAVIYTPIYRSSQPLDTPSERRAALAGFIANVFHVSGKIATVKDQFSHLQLLLKITDDGDELVNEKGNKPNLSLDFPKLEKTLLLRVADRTWRITYSAAPEFYAEQLNWNIWWLILSCFLFTGLTGIGLLMLTGRTMQTEDVVKIRTRELENEIHERTISETKIQRLTQLYAALSHCNQAIVRCTNATELYRQICRDSVKFGGMKMVWIGLADTEKKRLIPIACAGKGVDYLQKIDMALAPENSLTEGPCGVALRENRPVWCQDFLHDPMTAPWHSLGFRYGWGSKAVLPIHKNGLVIGIFCLYANKPHAFDEDVRDLLLKMAADISFALDNFDREEKRTQAEQSLQKNEQFLRTVIETEPECVKVVDKNGDLIEMNAAGLKMLEADSLEQLKQHKLLNLILPEYRDAFVALHKRVMKGEQGSLEFEIIGLKGSRRWLETYSAPLPDQNNNVVMLLGVTHDITQRKIAEQALQESENRLMLAIKGSNDAPWDWDLEKNRLYYSPQWWHMLGYETDELASNAELWQSLVHPDDIEFIQNDLRQALNSGQSMHAVEFRLRHKDGHYVPILERSFISRNKDGKVVRISGTNMDLTERRREQNLEEVRGFMLECITSSMPLGEILDAITHKIESLMSDAHCAILLLDDKGGHLHLASAPSLPNFYKSGINGLPVDDTMGCCGYAAVHGKSAVTADIAKDVRCDGMRMLLEQAGLASWWSEPIQGPDGKVLGTFAVYHRAAAMPNEYDHKLIETVAHYAALTIDRKRAETQLKLAAKVFEQSQEGFMITDARRRIVKVNPAFTAITGYTEQEAVGKSAGILSSGRHDREFYRNLWETIRSQSFWQGEIWNRRKNGEIYPELLNVSVVRDSFGNVSEYVGVFADITQLKASEAQLEFLAHHDTLTSLPNRLRLFFRLEHSIETAKREGEQLALLMLDLDRFKDVNDSFGHLAGDLLLQMVANRLVNRVRDIDTVARLGGDEFTVVLENISRPEDAARIAQAIIDDLGEPWSIPNTGEVLIGASIGISLYPQHGHTPELLLQQADAALYKAKEGGRNRFAFYSNEFTEAARRRIDMEARLRRALLQNELLVYYQPQIDIATGEIVGAEALVRWQDPIEGLILPNHFIPVAEQTGLIQAVGAWVLKETCRQGKEWLDKGLKPISLAVNVSQHQIRQSDINTLVADVLRETGFPAAQLELELTESGLMERQTDAIEILMNLRKQGVRLAIDDFGTGYSSLAYLKRFPLNVLKIDKTFIDDIPDQQYDMEIAATIIAMGHILGFKVLAEGVETPAQLAFLKEKGCDLYQGFLVSHPLPAAEFSAMMASTAVKDALLEKCRASLSGEVFGR